MKQITINIPDNCELKQDGDTYTIIERKEKKLTYEEVADKIFLNEKYHYYIQNNGDIVKNTNYPSNYKLPNNALSERQLEKLLAINMLMNVAKYLNGDWQPNWNGDAGLKYTIEIHEGYIITSFNTVICSNVVYFKSEELAKQAIGILGEETIKLALCTDY